MILVKIIRPPMVGVPCFFKWLCGPSSLTCWPNFSLCKNGMITGHSSALTANAMIIANIVSRIIKHLNLICISYLVISIRLFCRIINLKVLQCPCYLPGSFSRIFQIGKDIFKKSSNHRSCNGATIVDPFRLVNGDESNDLGIICRCKT